MPSNDSILDEEDNQDIIPSVLNGPAFKIRSNEEKQSILAAGRPLPKLNITKRDLSRNCNRSFLHSWYSIHKWLCGSKSYNKLFCWPCVLMRPETSTWCSTGIDDMKRFTSLAAKHTICKSHVKAISEYDEMAISFDLPPEYSSELNVKLKEEESLSDGTESDELGSPRHKGDFKKQKDTQVFSTQTEQNPSNPEDNVSASSNPIPSKCKTKITFKTWQEMNKNAFPISSSKFFEDFKLYKWKKRIARQELKNARLAGEKLKYEIEVLKAKVGYYKSLKNSSSKNVGNEHGSRTSITIEAGEKSPR